MDKDKGFAWIIMVSSFLINCIYGGAWCIFAVLLGEYIETFNINVAEASIVSSLNIGVISISGE